MARTRIILQAVWKAFRRDQGSLRSVSANNIQYFAMSLLFLGDPLAVMFFFVIVAVVLILPMSADPLAMVPRSRLLSWPFERRDLRILRVLSPWLNPMTWVLVALAIWKRVSIGVVLLIAAPSVLQWVLTSTPLGGFSVSWRRAPRFPGPAGLLVRKNLRQILSTLDFWVAFVIAIPAAIYRAMGLLPREALLPVTLLVVIAISTCALSLFGLDGAGGITRYRLLPLPGWQILAAKDAALFLVVIVLALPLSPVCAGAAILMGLAVAHRGSVVQRRVEARWRFQTSPAFAESLIQILAMAVAGSSAYRYPWLLLPCAGACAYSIWYFGGRLDAIGE